MKTLDSPLVSICIPTRNGGTFLRETLQSVVSQSYANLEILISDQESTDDTIEVIKAFSDDRIDLQEISSDGGAAANWNSVIRRARGKFVKLLCQDDLLDFSAVAAGVEGLDSNPDATFLFGPRDVISPKGRVILRSRGWQSIQAEFEWERDARQLVRSGTNIFGEPCTTLYRRSFLERTDGFRGSYLIDLDMCIQLLAMGPAIHSRESVSSFRISSSSWSKQLSGEQASQVRSMLESLRKERPDLISFDDVETGIVQAKTLERKRSFLLSAVRLLRI